MEGAVQNTHFRLGFWTSSLGEFSDTYRLIGGPLPSFLLILVLIIRNRVFLTGLLWYCCVVIRGRVFLDWLLRDVWFISLLWRRRLKGNGDISKWCEVSTLKVNKDPMQHNEQ